MAERKDQVVRNLRNGVKQLLAANGVKVFEGTASFESRKRIVVNSSSGNAAIGAEKTIIATGATSAMPGFLPRHERVVESRAFLDLKSAPAARWFWAAESSAASLPACWRNWACRSRSWSFSRISWHSWMPTSAASCAARWKRLWAFAS